MTHHQAELCLVTKAETCMLNESASTMIVSQGNQQLIGDAKVQIPAMSYQKNLNMVLIATLLNTPQ